MEIDWKRFKPFLGRSQELYNFMCKDEQFLKLNSNWV